MATLVLAAAGAAVGGSIGGTVAGLSSALIGKDNSASLRTNANLRASDLVQPLFREAEQKYLWIQRQPDDRCLLFLLRVASARGL